jgi:hypothetical protein
MPQKKREKKTSHGKHGGGGKTRLDRTTKILIGGGQLRQMRSVDALRPWTGAADGGSPADPEQARLNRSLYPGMFQ